MDHTGRRIDSGAEFIHDATIDAHPTVNDHFLCRTSTRDTGTSQHLLQPDARL
jgi:hypothetical protein